MYRITLSDGTKEDVLGDRADITEQGQLQIIRKEDGIVVALDGDMWKEIHRI